MKNRWVVNLASRMTALVAVFVPVLANATPPATILGVLTDMTGFVADASGKGSVVAAELAAQTFLAENPGADVRIVSADHLNKPDVGSAIAREWIERQGVNAILDVPNSSVALAVSEVVRGSHAALLVSSAGSVGLTGEHCSPNTVQWTYNTWALANGTARALTRAGENSWFFITADFAFGYALEADATKVIEALGGKVLGSVRHPPVSSDLGSYLLAAQASGASVIGLANSVTDTTNSIKEAAEFGIAQDGHQKMAALLLEITDVNSLGTAVAKGLYLTTSFYWDMNSGTRDFSDRYSARMNGARPTSYQAGVYSSALAYLRAIQRSGTNDAKDALAELRRIPVDDSLFGTVLVRRDGQAIHPMYLFEVKDPSEVKRPWDYYKQITTIPRDSAFQSLSESACKSLAK